MGFDGQMQRFFGTDDLGAASPAAMASDIERMQAEFVLESDKARRFAMWSLLCMLSSAPGLDVAFKDDRDAAPTFMDLLDQVNDDQSGSRQADICQRFNAAFLRLGCALVPCPCIG